MAETAPSASPTRKPPRRKRGWFLLLVGMFNAVWALIVLCALVAVAAVYFFYDRPVVLPGWVETRIEARLETEFPDAQITFGEVRLLMEEGWRPRVRLRDVAVAAGDGRELIRFSEARLRLSMTALRAGKLQAAELALRGVFATLIRDEQGQLSFQPGVGGPLTNIGDVVTRIDTALQQPGLEALERAEFRGLTLQYIDRRAGRAFTLDGGRLLLEREDGALVASADLAVLGDGTGATTLSANYSSPIGALEAQFGVRIEGASAADIATQSPAFAWLGALRAPISGAVRSGVRADGTLAPLSASLNIGAGALQPNEGTRPIPFEQARSYFTYDSAEGLLQFDEFSVDSKWGSLRGEGTATLAGLREGALETLVGQFALTRIRANPMDFYPEPVELEGAEVDFRLQTAPFKLDIGRLDVFDEGQTRHASGSLLAEPEGWRLALDAHTAGISAKRIIALWPEAVKPRTRDWLATNLIDADISNADFALRLSPGERARLFLALDYRAAEVKFMRGLPPVSQGRGHAVINDTRLVVSVDEGVLETGEGGPVAITQSSFIIPDLRVRGGAPAVVRLNTRSSVTAALWALDQPPLGIMGRVGVPVDLGSGEAVLEGTLSFPLKRGGSPADVVFDATGDLRDLSLSRLIRGRTLTADRMRLVAGNAGVSLAGQGALDGVPFDGSWEQPIGPARPAATVRGTAAITPAALRAFNVALPEGTLRGATQARIAIELPRGEAPRMILTSDLQGADLRIPQLGWRKGPGTPGALEMAVRLGAQPEVTGIALSGAGLRAQGRITLAEGGGLGAFELESLRLGDWLDLRAALLGQGPGRAPQIVVRGGTLDLRRAELGGGGGGASGAAGPPLRASLDRLQITDTIWLDGFDGTFTTAGGLSGPFEARLNGGTALTGRIVPQRGRTALRVSSQDAGGVLRSAGVLSQAVGGTLDLSLLPVGSGGAFDGRLAVDGISIRDAPAMAALVNAISVVGLVNEMNGDGIYFDEVEAEFRLTPGRMTLTRGSAVGASLGLSMDGVFATDTGQIAMQGVITPVYLINGLGSLLTRKGEGILGFNYSLGGAAKSPQVSVNPLSMLAPGGLRNIFRPPQTVAPPVEGAPAPLTAPAPQPVEPVYEGR